MPIFRVHMMGDSDEIEADSAKDAAQSFVDRADRQEPDQYTTVWFGVETWDLGDPAAVAQDVLVAVHPPEPVCVPGRHHLWEARRDVVGGLRENPGVFSSGGGSCAHTVCHACGWRRKMDGSAQDPETGTQGLSSVSYVHDPSVVDVSTERVSRVRSAPDLCELFGAYSDEDWFRELNRRIYKDTGCGAYISVFGHTASDPEDRWYYSGHRGNLDDFVLKGFKLGTIVEGLEGEIEGTRFDVDEDGVTTDAIEQDLKEIELEAERRWEAEYGDESDEDADEADAAE